MGLYPHEAWRDIELREIDPSHVAAARRVAERLSTEAAPAREGTETCLDCVFWHGQTPQSTRGYGCDIWYLVQIEHGAAIPDAMPTEDGLTCSQFALGKGTPATCYDCAHWDQDKLAVPRREGCRAWDDVRAKERDLRNRISRQFGSNVDFSMFQTSCPYDDCGICPYFAADPALPADYGADQVQRARSEEEWRMHHTPRRRRIAVVGLPYEGREAIWRHYYEHGARELRLRREPENPHDACAVAVWVDGQHAGYVPAENAKDIAAMMDEGWKPRVLPGSLHVRWHERKRGGEVLRVNLTAEFTYRPAGESEAMGAPAGAGEAPVGAGATYAPTPLAPLPDDTFPATPEVLQAACGPKDELPDALDAIKARERLMERMDAAERESAAGAY